jgi:hypothetical protein
LNSGIARQFFSELRLEIVSDTVSDMIVALEIEFPQLYFPKFEAKGVYIFFFVSEDETVLI